EDGERVYYYTSEKNPNFFDIKVRNLVTAADDVLLKGEDAPTFLTAVSKNEEIKVYQSMLANTYNKIFIVRDGEKEYLVPDPEKVHVSFSPVIVGETIYFSTNYDSEFNYLAKYDMNSGEFSTVLR